MKKNATALFIFCCIWSTAAVHHVQAAACPTSDRYAMVNYNHNLLNRTASPVSTFSQGSSLLGPVGIEIGPAGITNAGNNVVQRTMEVLITDPDCDCPRHWRIKRHRRRAGKLCQWSAENADARNLSVNDGNGNMRVPG